MNYSDFKNSLNGDAPSSIYLFEGEDAFFRERGAELLKEKFVSEPDLNYAVLNGEKLSDKELIGSLTVYPFMSQKRLTVVREYYPNKDGVTKALKEYFENPVADSVLAILNEKPSDALKKFSTVTVIECKRADSSTIARWIKATCSAEGVEIELQTARTIADYCLADMVRVEGETKKLISYALDKKVITKEDVEGLVNKDVEHKIYKMTEHIAKKQFDLAFSVIEDMLSKGESLQRLLVSIYNYFRRLLHVAISDKTDKELSKLLKIEPFAVENARRQANAFKKKSLKNAVDLLAETDYGIKSGKVDADDRIWYSIFKIITE